MKYLKLHLIQLWTLSITAGQYMCRVEVLTQTYILFRDVRETASFFSVVSVYISVYFMTISTRIPQVQLGWSRAHMPSQPLKIEWIIDLQPPTWEFTSNVNTATGFSEGHGV